MPEPSSWSTAASSSLWLGWLLVAAASACRQDVVQAGFYGEPDAGPARTISSSTGMLGAMAATTPGTGASLAGAGSTDAPSGGTPDGMGAPSAGTAGNIGAPRASAGAGAAPDPACDMTGRWILTHHVVVDGLGQLQTAHSWKYFEIEQQGEQLIIKRGLHCGDDVTANTLLAANVDLHSSWPGTLANNDYRAMNGTSRATADGCEISFGKYYTVTGATAAYYRDPGHPMPMPNQKASATAPGWEDWDNDGHPGVTMVVSGAATGSLYSATRVWHQLSTRVHDTAGLIKFPDNWNQEVSLLGYDGSELLTEQGVRAADMSLHFAEAARLDPSDAQGDDTATCAAVRKLAKTLTPNASQN
jgi:hypothetical protein